ncbi:hypothetical protein HAX54_040859 [Datura stramonium]|uniref:Uncharacterized protein n=1 Tax=Datura stramonium TaxID=4076 RepID=A0ABS8SKI7_DATST|nr:hypothetical protein [Datura stramonium]
MEWPKILESSHTQERTFDLFSAAPHDNREVAAQADQWTFENFEIENPISENRPVVAVDNHDHDYQHYQLPQDQDDSDMEVTLDGTPPPLVENNCPCRQRRVTWTEREHTKLEEHLKVLCCFKDTNPSGASHAHKYFSHQNSTTPVERRRSSINDMQTISFNPMAPTTVPMGYEMNNGRLAFNNNHQAGNSSLSFLYPYGSAARTLNNNLTENFGRFNQGEASGSSSFDVE